MAQTKYYNNTKVEEEVLEKTSIQIKEIQEMLISSKEDLSENLYQETRMNIIMKLKPLLYDIKRASIYIPYVALQPNNPNCLNQFNDKQVKTLQKNYNKYKIQLHNCDNVSKSLGRMKDLNEE